MILRVFQVTVHNGKAEEFEQFFQEIAIPQVKKWPGLISMSAGKPQPGASNTFCMTMIWKDLDALKTFAGEDWSQARIEPEEEHLIASISLSHYDLMAASGAMDL